MIEDQREMLTPGAGIVRDAGALKQHEEFPRYMTHPAYQRGKPDQEIKEMGENGQPTGRLFYRGGEAIRFPPVLVKTAADRDFHLSQGYADNGKSDAAAFARAVADAAPMQENYVAIEYPKYCFGKIVNDAVEEEAHLIALNINKDGTPRTASSEPAADQPKLNAEANTLEVWPAKQIAAAVIAELAEQPASEEDEIAALEARLTALKARAANKTEEPPFGEAEAPTPVADEKAAKNAARVAKIKATLARKKAEREAVAQQGEQAA